MFGEFKKRYINYFSISLIAICTIAILQYIGFNPFNMYQDGIGTHNVSFFGTIGNIDFMSAMLVIMMSVSFISYVFLKRKKWENILSLISIFMGTFIIGIIGVSSGKVAFIATLILIAPFILLSSERLSKTILMLCMVLLGYGVNLFINPKYYYDGAKLVFEFQFNAILFVYMIVIAILVILSKTLRKDKFIYEIKDKKKFIKRLYMTIAILGILLVIVLYLFDLRLSILHEIHDLLHGNFNDEYGTYRIFLWKRALKLVPDNWLIGTGPDTFAVRFMPVYYNDIIGIGELTINDTAANVYLTMLVNIGILGLSAYVIFLILEIIAGIRTKTDYSFVLMFATICYIIQDFFNLWVVIVTPVFWVLMGVYNLSINKESTVHIIGGKNGKK